MQPQISVIVPIYKAESFIHRCIDSILAQTFTDFELILVNDGSPDKSGSICDEYALADSRIKVIHKKNGGVASARQCGIDNASGTYTIHTDPDDWIEPNMLEELYNKAIKENADIVVCDFWVEEKNQTTLCKQEPSSFDPQRIIIDLLLDRLHGSLCNKLIKLSCYRNSDTTFVNGLNYCEDFLVCCKLLTGKITVTYLNKAFYHYDQSSNSNSITKNYDIAIHNQIRLLAELQNVLKEERFIEALHHKKAQLAELAIKYPTLNSKEYKRIFYPQRQSILPHIKSRFMKFSFIIAANGRKNLVYSIYRIARKAKRMLLNKRN